MATLIRASLLVTLLGSLAAAPAAVVHDPWLARFEVGDLRAPAAVDIDDTGWPADLFAPLAVDPGWLAGAEVLIGHATIPQDGDLVGWRLAVPALGDRTAAERSHARARTQARRLAALAPETAPPLADEPPDAGPWAAATVALQASRLWQAGRWSAAADVCERLLAAPLRASVSASGALVWTLRAEALRERAGHAVNLGRIWDAALDLGPYDDRSGWALWLALRRARGLPPLDPAAADRDAAVFLAGADALFLEPDAFRALGFAPELEAGLGALLLPRGDLDDHFARHPGPPADGRFQGYWLRGQRRRDGSAAAVERLARLPDLKDGHRLDLWRRASEKRLLRDEWSQGLEDLGQALALVAGDASAWMRGRLREWTVQALALALARERTGDAARVVALAEHTFGGDDIREFRADAAALLRRLGRDAPVAGPSLRERGEGLVRRGESPDIGARPALALPTADRWRHRLWGAWAEWGLALLEDEPAPTAGQRERMDALRSVLATSDPAQRHATACAVAARGLHGVRAVSRLLDHAWQRDVEILAGGRAVPTPTPLPDLLEPAPWRTLAERLRGHAMLGVALALGDDRGVIAAAVRLPAGGLDDATYRLFWYPLPGDPAVRDVLATSGLPPELLLAIARNESLFEPAIRSRAGALGYMQIMPFHYDDPAAASGQAHWSHPATSLVAGARILAGEARAFAGDPYRAVAAYNAGRGAVRRWGRQLSGVDDRDLFWAWIGYPETRGYTLRVLRDREVYRWLLGPRP
jgi:hypothetical protein